jgi:hypothetical protein
LVDRLGKKEPEFGSYAGQLGTGHGMHKSVPLPREREFEELIMVEVLIEEKLPACLCYRCRMPDGDGALSKD